uniref:Uncharacterized protein n=1 Tax=Schistocephalus solidus TaxID=70667 RepID=A0A0X3NQL6_SCHSO
MLDSIDYSLTLSRIEICERIPLPMLLSSSSEDEKLNPSLSSMDSPFVAHKLDSSKSTDLSIQILSTGDVDVHRSSSFTRLRFNLYLFTFSSTSRQISVISRATCLLIVLLLGCKLLINKINQYGKQISNINAR